MPAMEAVIFDMDGLMLASEPLQSEAFACVLREEGVEPELTADGLVTIVGLRGVDNWARLKEKHGLAPSVAELDLRKRQHYHRIISQGVEPAPGLITLLESLHQRRVKKAVGSSSVASDITMIVGTLHAAGYFDVLVSGEQVERGKPAPDIFLEAARQLKVSAAECVVLGDTTHDIAAAKAAGMLAVGVPNEYTLHQDFSQADAIFSSLAQITPDGLHGLFGA
jgi:HAD superfamily hydrolase (TIGR01509 family)